MEKIQIVQFVEDLGRGGLENVVYHLATRLNPRLFDVNVVCRVRGGYTAEQIAQRGISIKILHQKKIPIWALANTLTQLRTNDTALIHCHGLFATSSEAIIAKTSGYKSSFVHVHNLEKPASIFQKLKLNVMKRKISKFIAVSEEVSTYLGYSSIKNVEVIHNGVDTRRYPFCIVPKKHRYGFVDRSFVLGMIGRIVKRKGFDQFVEVIASVPNTSGVIVGTGPYEATLKSLIAEKNLQNRIKCLPFQPQEKLPDIYSSIDALFLFSEREGLPLALLEAQSVGVPYIGNSVGGIGEVVKDGYNGFILDKIGFHEVSDRINKIRENVTYYRNNARKVVEEKYSLDKAIISTENLYMESLGEKLRNNY
jgi:glycosyltransferase involved in cell wall biosynthesis